MDCKAAWAVALVMAVSTQADALDLAISKSTFAKLGALKSGEEQRIDRFPISASHATTMHLRRVEVYSPVAHIYLITAEGPKELPRSNRIFLRGYSDDGSARVAIALNADRTFADGSGSGLDGSFALRYDAKGLLSATSLESTIPAGTQLTYRCGNEGEILDVGPRSLSRTLGLSVASAPAVAATTAALKSAVVAVDTDVPFMSELFANDTQQATNWIAGMFNTMNTMYERDLSVQLLQGTTFLRTSTDPYGSATDVPADTHDLDVFGAYWKANESSVQRTFATLLSGRGGPCTSGSQCTASGIAWIDAYCQTGFVTSQGYTAGSYSVVQVFSSLGVDPQAAIAARLVGHELGHNFGAWHTHCTDKSSGDAPVTSNTIDQCFDEPGSGCYNSATSCPSSGPGAPMGTIMSYCNVKGCPAKGSQNVLQFHPTQISSLDGIIAAESSCLGASDIIFANGFEP